MSLTMNKKIYIPSETLTRWVSTLQKGKWHCDVSAYGDVYITRDVNPIVIVRTASGPAREAYTR